MRIQTQNLSQHLRERFYLAFSQYLAIQKERDGRLSL